MKIKNLELRKNKKKNSQFSILNSIYGILLSVSLLGLSRSINVSKSSISRGLTHLVGRDAPQRHQKQSTQNSNQNHLTHRNAFHRSSLYEIYIMKSTSQLQLSGGPYLSAGLRLYYLGGKNIPLTNYIIAAADGVVKPIANFLPLLPEYFLFVVPPRGLMPQFLTLPK